MSAELDRHLGFLKNFIFSKKAANFLGISRKHMFTASNTNIIKNKMKKKTNFAKKLQFLFSNFNLQNSILHKL